MGNNIYGTVKPANFNPSTDVDVYYIPATKLPANLPQSVPSVEV